MRLTEIFKIDGVPMLAPDEEMEMQFSDLDAEDTGRDESGYMHRVVIRPNMGVWSFSYSHLTDDEKAYMEGLFKGKEVFEFTHPDPEDGSPRTVTAYRSNYGITWRSVYGGWANYKFNIIEC